MECLGNISMNLRPLLPSQVKWKGERVVSPDGETSQG
jgi:hypothetical protein